MGFSRGPLRGHGLLAAPTHRRGRARHAFQDATSHPRTRSQARRGSPRGPLPAALTETERARILAHLNSDQFVDKAPNSSGPPCST
jgi:hypothetical protein